MTRLLKPGLVPGLVVRAVWPAAVGSLAVLYAAIGDGAWTRRSAIAWMMGSWGARLTMQTLYTRSSDLPFLTSYFRLLASALFFSLPAWFASRNTEPSLAVVEIGACALWVMAFAVETTADRQLLRFTSKPENAGLPCRSGIWRVMPRAHAAGEALIWTAFALFAAGSAWGWTAFACPAAMLYFLMRRC